MSTAVHGTVAPPAAEQRRWTFAGVEFDERSFELRVRGQPVQLEPKPLEVLLHLLRHAGEIVTKEELLAAVWPGRILTDNSLPKSISRIRDVIGDDEQAVIKTVHGYGYRLVAPVIVQAAKAAPALTRLDLKAGDHPPLRPQWSLVGKLGGGGQGEVWLVRHDKTREQRVFKFALDVAGLAAIKREITLYRFLRETLEGRDEFTRVIDWNLEEAPYYIELEHGAGGNLEEWAEAAGGLATVPLATRLDLVARIAEALAAAHSVGVLHKDLKPSNVLVIPSPLAPKGEEVGARSAPGEGPLRIKLADFGSGGVLDPKRLEALGITRLGFTQSIMQGEAAATAMYLAPEVMSGQPSTVQADIYSLGVLLYQMVVGDLKRPLAPGWEHRVGDDLLCEDIALAVAGEPARRLADASALATRLRTLEDRRRARAAEQAERRRLEQEQKAAEERARKAELAVERLRTRRAWQRTVLAILIVAVSISLGLFLQARQARNEAAAAAASSQAVADFLSKDLFAQVGERPLRELTVQELLASASSTLDQRQLSPAVAAQLHGALGGAFLAVEAFSDAEKHLQRALALTADTGGAPSPDAVALGAHLLLAAGQTSMLDLTPYERLLERAVAGLGPTDASVLALRHNVAQGHLLGGQWRRASAEFRSLLADAGAVEPRPDAVIASAACLLSWALVRLGEPAEAAAVVRAAIASDRRPLDEQRHEASGMRAHLGLALAEQGQLAEADAEIARAEELMRPWTANDQSAHLAATWALQGRVRHLQGRHEDAIRLLRRAVDAVALQPWNLELDATYEMRSWLADALAAAGRRPEALAQARIALPASERSLGARNPTTQDIRIQLALLLAEDGQRTEAASLAASVSDADLAELGAGHRIKQNLAALRQRLDLSIR